MNAAALRLNGAPVQPAVPPGTPLLAWLRNDCGLNGPKYGCGFGECGACLVLVDERPARACTLSLGSVAGREVTTLEGLRAREAGTECHPVQAAFIDAQAAQCGYCLNGMIMATVALLKANPQPTDAQARAALSHNLCRCGTHVEILRAVQLAAARLRVDASARPMPMRVHDPAPDPPRARPMCAHDSALDPCARLTPR